MAMITQLTKSERQLAIGVLLVIACVGIAFAGAGKNDPLGVHGFLIVALVFVLLGWIPSWPQA
jgi:cytochrome c oxidase cbb3-type subunit 1